MNLNSFKFPKKPIILIPLILGLIFLISLIIFLNKQKKNNANQFFSVAILDIPKNLDPQTATSPTELTIIDNIFEGLYRKTDNNEFELGMADLVKTNETNKTKTFKIKKNIYWQVPSKKFENFKQIEITAKDFLFSFRRLLNPETNSPAAKNFYFLKNAQKVNEKKLPLNKLGVKINENDELVLEMEYFPPNLEELLASAPAMPCNEKFFNHTKGCYGTGQNMLLYNGPFYIHNWLDSQDVKKIRIRKNKLYNNLENVKPLGINFSVRRPQEAVKMFKKKDIDIIFVDYHQFESLEVPKNQYKAFQNSTIGVCFNQNNNILQNENIRKAFAFDVDDEKLQQVSSSEFTPTCRIVPDSITIGSAFYKTLIENKNARPSYSPETAKDLLNSASANLKSPKNKPIDFNSLSILVNELDYSVLNQVLQTWQKDLGIFLKLDIQPKETYLKKLNTKDFNIALITITSDFNSPNSILSKFSDSSPIDYLNLKLENYNKILNNALTEESPKTTAEEFLKAEELICQNGYFIPLYQQTKFLVWTKKVKHLNFSEGNQQLYFKYVSIT